MMIIGCDLHTGRLAQSSCLILFDSFRTKGAPFKPGFGLSGMFYCWIESSCQRSSPAFGSDLFDSFRTKVLNRFWVAGRQTPS